MFVRFKKNLNLMQIKKDVFRSDAKMSHYTTFDICVRRQRCLFSSYGTFNAVALCATGLQRAGAGRAAVLGSPGRAGEQA